MPEDRRHAAIMFTDIVGYTALMGRDEDAAFDMLSRNHNLHEALIEKHNGILIKEVGDGTLASFPLASNAVRCAMDIQKEAKDQKIPLKIGIHEGEMVFAGGDVLGDGVNIASRLQEETQEGCITISGKVYSDVKNKAGINIRFIGDKKLKNVSDPVKVYEVLCEGEQNPMESTPLRNQRKYLYYILAGIVVVLIAFIVWQVLPSKETAPITNESETVEIDESIAVLPFDFLGEDQTKRYQADGVMTAIFNHLSKIKELRIIGKTSTEKYEENPVDPREMGNDLNVSYLLSGSLQMIGNNARLNVGLINTNDGSTVWSNNYDREWKDIFKVQSEVAQAIASEIKVVITPEEKRDIETIATSDLTAYDYYLRGKEYQLRSMYEEDYKTAIQLYEKAVNLDSAFVLAWVGLASASRFLYWFYFDRSEEQLIKIKKYLDCAISLSPNLKEVQLEEGIYYLHCKRDFPKALQILESLKSKYPNDDETYKMIGNVYRRMGDYNISLEYYNHAISLNPSNWNYWHNNAFTFWVLRKYDDAENCIKRSIELNPSYHNSQYNLLRLYANMGQIEKAKSYLKSDQKFIDQPDIKLIQAYIEILDGNYEEALQIIQSLSEEVFNDQIYFHTKHLQLGLIYHMMSNKEMAIKHFELEKTFLLGKIDKTYNDSRIYRSLGIAYAGLGMKNEAIEAGEKALEILSFSNDAMLGYFPEMDMVKILILVGEYEDALTRLEYIISQNGEITTEVLKLDPFWNPVRDMDKFQEIISNPKYQISLLDN